MIEKLEITLITTSQIVDRTQNPHTQWEQHQKNQQLNMQSYVENPTNGA